MPRVNKIVAPALIVEWGHESKDAIFGDLLIDRRKLGSIDINREALAVFKRLIESGNVRVDYSVIFQSYELSAGKQVEDLANKPVPKKKAKR